MLGVCIGGLCVMHVIGVDRSVGRFRRGVSEV